MKKNLNLIDRVVRILLAAVLGILIINGTITGIAGILAGIFAIVFLATGIISFCPIYHVLGISTSKKETKTA